ncbi:MAG: LVIVD repeat-containing protein [Gemmatimonadales bacterium]
MATVRPSVRSLVLALGAVTVASCASSTGGSAPSPAPRASSAAPNPDPRVGLHAGVWDAGQAAWNLRLVSTTPPPEGFVGVTNSDLAFLGNYVIQGNYNGYQVWDISNPARPTLKTAYLCPASQSDVSVYRNLLFVSGEGLTGRIDCGAQGVPDTVSKERLRGLRIFDISDITRPRNVGNVQTCRGSHTHTVLVDPNDHANVYVYISGSAPVRSSSELPGCSEASPERDPNSALFRIEVIKVPLAHPERAAIVSSPRIFNDLAAAPTHGEAPEDIAAQEAALAAARKSGGFIVKIHGEETVLGPAFTGALLDSIVAARRGTGAPTAADSAALRGGLPALMAKMTGAPADGSPPVPTGPTQCHDITVYPAIGLAGGACGGYGLLLDIRDPANPNRIAAVADSNFSYWHSATFSNDGTKLLFTDEWGGGTQPKCRATDKMEWGANALFTRSGNQLTFRSYYKMPAAQTPQENCVAHNGSLIPIPGRDVMVQAWYQGGISVFDWTDPAHPREIAFFDRGPVDATTMVSAGSWSVYWYNGVMVSSEIARGLDIFELTPSVLVSQNEIDAAKTVRFDYLNTQGQPKLIWPPSFALARAYLDQLERSNGMAAEQISDARTALANAERRSAQERRDALTVLATWLNGNASRAGDQAKARMLAAAIADLANVKR